MSDDQAKRRYINQYVHHFEDGTCHLLPKTENYEDPRWVQWRVDHPNQWQWRRREVDAQGCLVRDSEGRYIRPGPWLNSDGTKHRSIDAASPEGRKILAAWAEQQKAWLDTDG
jgi:hypothetical protein